VKHEKIDEAKNIIVLAFEEESYNIESAFNQPTKINL
jgi:hypothetical protein